MNKWKTLPLEDCMAAIIDYRGKTPTKTTSGIPLITAKIVRDGRIDEPSEFINPASYDRWMTRGLPEAGDIVLTTEAPLGEVAQLDGRKVALAQRIITLRGKPGTLDNKYLKYVLQSDSVKSQLLGRASGSTVSGIKQSELRKVELPLPPIDEQQAIGSTLGALDDKIDLNRRMNETLEQAARTLFKDWFVDFGPTKAKMAGQAAYLEGGLWDLFPERLNEAGMPEGWRSGFVEDLFVLQRGFDLPKAMRTDGSYPVLAASGPNGTHSEYKVHGPGVTTGRSGVLGNVFLIQEDFWPLNTSLWAKSFVKATPVYAYFFLQELDVASYNAGSAVPTLNRNHIQSLPAKIPPNELVVRFTDNVMPMFEQQKRNTEESDTLTQIRDLLLPKLMSGELRLHDVETQICEAI